MLLRRVCLRLHICVMVSILFVDVRLVSIYFFFLSFFSFVEYILHKYGISAISFACWTFCIFQSHIMISGTSWKKFQNSLVEWQKEAQTEWNKTWALSAIRRETIDTPVYFCTVCRWKCIRAHQSVMKFMNANRSTNEFMCRCMFTIQYNNMFFDFIKCAREKTPHSRTLIAWANERICAEFEFANESDAGLENVLNLRNQINWREFHIRTVKYLWNACSLPRSRI